jgi:hypothetical protein
MPFEFRTARLKMVLNTEILLPVVKVKNLVFLRH